MLSSDLLLIVLYSMKKFWEREHATISYIILCSSEHIEKIEEGLQVTHTSGVDLAYCPSSSA
jgi:hypothetical protein